jgi:hypothetical protein
MMLSIVLVHVTRWSRVILVVSDASTSTQCRICMANQPETSNAKARSEAVPCAHTHRVQSCPIRISAAVTEEIPVVGGVPVLATAAVDTVALPPEKDMTRARIAYIQLTCVFKELQMMMMMMI